MEKTLLKKGDHIGVAQREISLLNLLSKNYSFKEIIAASKEMPPRIVNRAIITKVYNSRRIKIRLLYGNNPAGKMILLIRVKNSENRWYKTYLQAYWGRYISKEEPYFTIEKPSSNC